MMMAKAIVAREPAPDLKVNWALEEVMAHPPGEGEVLVQIVASGICHTDILLTSVPSGTLGVTYPKVVGHEGAGIVHSVGKDVSNIEIGDPILLSFFSCSSCWQCKNSHPAYCTSFAQANYVGEQKFVSARDGDESLGSSFFGQSSFAQYTLVKYSSIVKVKDLLHHDDELKLFSPLGCGFQTGMGAIQNITSAGPEDIVMIQGLGAVGMGALMTAKMQKCKATIAVDKDKARLELAKTLGASHTLDTSDPEFISLDQAVREIFPHGVSIVIETTGVPTLIEQGLESTHTRGKIVLIGVPPFGYSLGVNVTKHINAGRAILGCIEGDCVPQIAIPQMIKWYREGQFPINKLVKYFDATDYQQALKSLKEGTVIKPILVWAKGLFQLAALTTMSASQPHVMLAISALSGIATHITIFRHGEWDVQAPKIVLSYLTLFIGAIVLDFAAKAQYVNFAGPYPWLVKGVWCHILGIYGSMMIYRAFFHRLSQFPGPFLARLSNFYVTSLSARKLHLYEETEKLHGIYGDYVRLGPTELSITDPNAVKALYSSQAKVSKGPWYTILEPRVSLQQERNKQEHARRRKAWDQAFSARALRDYEPRVSHYTSQLIDAIEKHLGSSMDISRWFNYYSFDVMGDLSFGESFNMLVDGKDAYILKQLHADMKGIGLFSHLTWLFPFVKRIPGLNREYLKLWTWVGERVNGRIRNNSGRPDVFSWVLKAYEQGPRSKQDTLNLHGDAYLIIIAGSDTTAATLTNIFFHIVSDQALYKKLQDELDALSDLSHDKLREIKLLDAVINETLRLHPAVPSGTQRLSPPEGMTISGKYVPGDVMLCIPSHALFRDGRVFARPDEFLPERWTTKPELVKDPSAFIPFNTGPYSCAGKQLALMELRCVMAEIVTKYDISFAPSQKASAFLDGKQDTFTLVTAPLELVFKKRGISA
ncbi:hypothetical protein F1880_001608 [Penicillium rolfsii]|nr:hypothetical protein F1880_001608 [Penicillium rolfsii]